VIAAAAAFGALALLASTPDATLVAAGDIASCSSRGDEATAALVARIQGTVAVLGDSAYERGTSEDFARCYAPSWGRFRSRTRAALGNHEYYGGEDAAAAKRYFRLPARGYYSYELGAWHIVVLNSNCSYEGGCGTGSPQQRWLARDLERHRTRCTAAYWHHPRWSSGIHGSDSTVASLWRTLANAGADVVLAGHDHHYERFAPIDGIRSFVVGTGGRSHYPVLIRQPGSQVVNDRTYGVLRLTLRPASYLWRFVPVTGSTFRDAGSARCR
jgi:Calcineurin-like phosphoesterase